MNLLIVGVWILGTAALYLGVEALMGYLDAKDEQEKGQSDEQETER